MTRHNLSPTGTDDVNFDLVTEFKGYDSSIDPTNAPKDILVQGSQNVYKKLSGTIANRPGLKLRGARDATVAGVTSAITWKNSSGKNIPIRVANSKLQFESDIVTSGTYVWYTLLSSLTTTAWVFDVWWNNTLKIDTLLAVGGTATLYNWSGGLSLVSSTTANTIVLDRTVATSRITAASGTVTINGNDYTYTGSSGSTLTGVTPDPTGEANNSVVFEKIGTNSNQPASGFINDFIRVINNKVYVGSYTSRLIYISKSSSYTDYTQSTPRLTTDGDLITLDNNGKGIGVRNGHAWIAAGTSDWYEISYEQTFSNSVLTELLKVDKKPTSLLSAPISHDFIDMVGNEIICLSQDFQVNIIGNFANQFQTKYPTLSIPVKTEFRTIGNSSNDFTGGHLKAIGNIIYITVPLIGTHYMHETRESIDILGNIKTERFWHPPQISGISRFVEIGGIIYGHSNANPMIYRIWDTNQWYDDSPTTGTSGQLSYNSIMLMSYRNGGLRQGKLNFSKEFVEGYATQNSQLYAGLYYDYQGASGILNPPINTSDSLFAPKGIFIGSAPPSLGDDSLGDNPLGSGVITSLDDQQLVPKFKQIIGVSQIDCFEYALMVYSQNPSARWEVLALGVNPRLSFAEATEITK